MGHEDVRENMQDFHTEGFMTTGETMQEQTKIVNSQILQSDRLCEKELYQEDKPIQGNECLALGSELHGYVHKVQSERSNNSEYVYSSSDPNISGERKGTNILNVLQQALSNVQTFQINHQLFHCTRFVLFVFISWCNSSFR